MITIRVFQPLISFILTGAIAFVALVGLTTSPAIARDYASIEGIKIQEQQAAANGETLYTGDEKKIGDGYVRTWVKLNKDNKPTSLGVTMTEGGLHGLPDDPDTGKEKGQDATRLQLLDRIGHYTFEYELLFPPEAKETAFNHMGYNWNMYGHWPQGVFTEGHYDVHFYMGTPEKRHGVAKATYKDVLTAHKPPDPRLKPKGYEAAYGTVEPRMGVHWADFSSPQLQPGKFTNIFLFGFYDGDMVFWEPMITRKYLLKKEEYREVVAQPQAYPKSGYYPLSYSIHHDKDRNEIDISLDEMTYRPGIDIGVAQ